MKPLFYLFFAAIGVVPGYEIYREAGPKITEKMKAQFASPERSHVDANLAASETAHRDYIDQEFEQFRNYMAQHPAVPGSSAAVSFYDRYLLKTERHEESHATLAEREELLRKLARREESMRVLAEREEALRILAHREEELRLAELREKSHREPDFHHEPNGGLNSGSDKSIHEHKEPDWFTRTTSNWTSPFQKTSSGWPQGNRGSAHAGSSTGEFANPLSFPAQPTAGPRRPTTEPGGSTAGPLATTTGPLHPTAPTTTSSHNGPPPPALPHPHPVVTTSPTTTTTLTH